MTQPDLLNTIYIQIAKENILHGKKIKRNISKLSLENKDFINSYLSRYSHVLKSRGESLNDAVGYYLKMIADINVETIQFQETGVYAYSTFNEINSKVYNDPSVMKSLMHGLFLSQFLWYHHFELFQFYKTTINNKSNQLDCYLEIGGGHGLYISELLKSNVQTNKIDLLDISESSIELAKEMIDDQKVNYLLSDIFDYNPDYRYDFISMCEVLEHVENPVKLLLKVKSLLKDKGKLFITTPTNAPTIDHIYLFKNIQEIKTVILKAGFEIESEQSFLTEEVTPELAERFKISTLYAALLTPKF